MFSDSSQVHLDVLTARTVHTFELKGKSMTPVALAQVQSQLKNFVEEQTRLGIKSLYYYIMPIGATPSGWRALREPIELYT